MTRVIRIDYDLRAPGRNYERLYDWIKSHEMWVHPLESCWLVKTTKDMKTVFDEAQNRMDANDRLVVMDVTGDAWWTNLPSGDGRALEWMHRVMGTVFAT